MSDQKVATDTNGRKYTLRELTPGSFMDLLEAAGGASQNAGYLRYAMAVASVIDIDGVPVPMPQDRRQLRALGDKIGNDGMIAIFNVLFPQDSVPGTVDTSDPALATAGN
jgi:hypothetical protein